MATAASEASPPSRVPSSCTRSIAYGSEEQKDHWLPRLASGEAIGCFGLTEPDFGSNPGGMITRAEETSRRLRAERREDVDHERHHRRRRGGLGEAERRRSTGSWWRRGRKGFSAPEMKGKHSLRASVTSELIFQDVHDPEGRTSSRRRRAQAAALLSEPGALRHRLGRGRCGDGVLRCRAATTPRPASSSASRSPRSS